MYAGQLVEMARSENLHAKFSQSSKGRIDMIQTQGALANKSGSVLENLVQGTLQVHGFEVVKYRDYIKKPGEYGKELLLKNAPFKTLYGGNGNTEFLLLSEKYGLEIRIECKWQQSAGSVDEKFPHLYLSAVEAIPENDVILLVDGNGFREVAVKWLRETAEKRKYIPQELSDKSIQVMNSTDFLTWANMTFR